MQANRTADRQTSDPQRTDLERIGSLVALRAGIIGELDLGPTDRPDALLDNIDELVDLADLARWSRGDGTGRPSPAAVRALAELRRDAVEDLDRIVADGDWHEEDVAAAQDSVAMFDQLLEPAAQP